MKKEPTIKIKSGEKLPQFSEIHLHQWLNGSDEGGFRPDQSREILTGLRTIRGIFIGNVEDGLERNGVPCAGFSLFLNFDYDDPEGGETGSILPASCIVDCTYPRRRAFGKIWLPKVMTTLDHAYKTSPLLLFDGPISARCALSEGEEGYEKVKDAFSDAVPNYMSRLSTFLGSKGIKVQPGNHQYELGFTGSETNLLKRLPERGYGTFSDMLRRT